VAERLAEGQSFHRTLKRRDGAPESWEKPNGPGFSTFSLS